MQIQEKLAKEYLEETNGLIEDIKDNTENEHVRERINNIITEEKLQKMQKKDEHEEMINSIDDEAQERTKTEDEDQDNN